MKKFLLIWVTLIMIASMAVCESNTDNHMDIDMGKESSKDEIVPMLFLDGTLPTDKTETVMGFRYLSETESFQGYCKIKCQGTSSMDYAKKNFTIKIYSDEECLSKKKFQFRNWTAQNKYCLKANWIDYTHARNVVCARLWGDMLRTRHHYAEIPQELRNSPNCGAVDGFFTKVYVNGDYYGRYTLNIPKDEWMANLDDKNDNHCILVSERCLGSGAFLAPARIDGTDWSDELHKTVPNSILTRWNEVIDFVMNATDEEFITEIDNYIDIESIIDYDIFGVVLCGSDSFGKNQLFITYDGQKWYMSMYDMDSNLGLMWNGSTLFPADYRRGQFTDRGMNLLLRRVEKLFGPQIAERYREVSNGVLSVENINHAFEEFISTCPPELMEEDKVFVAVDGTKYDAPLSDTNTLQFIQQFVVDRKPYNDQYFEKLARNPLFTYGAEDDYGEQIVSLNQPYWSDGYEYLDTMWTPYSGDSDWTLVMKFKDDIVPDGTFSALFNIRDLSDSSDQPTLFLKTYIPAGQEMQYMLTMGSGQGFAFSADQFFTWCGGNQSTDGHHYLILVKKDDNYDIWFDGSVLWGYGAPLNGRQSTATLKLFATTGGHDKILEKECGTIEVFTVYNFPFSHDQVGAMYNELLAK